MGKSFALKPTLRLLNNDFSIEEVYPELPDKDLLPNELEAFMWLWFLRKYEDCEKPDALFLSKRTPDFIRIRTWKEFVEYLPCWFYEGSDTPIKGKSIHVNQKFEYLFAREALTASVFVMDNKTMLHVGNTYKYLDYAQILFEGRLSGDGFSKVSFSLLTDLFDAIPVMSLYEETIAGIFIDRTDPENVIQIVMDKYTAVVIFHRLYSLCQEQLLREEDVSHSSGDLDNPFVKEFHRICDVIRGIDRIGDLKEELLRDDEEDE